jgi:CubicO group peptidase (beta-lactamase class C family)
MMTLVEKGALDLDRPLNDYLPGAKLRSFAGDPREITLRRLANHTAGLPTHYNFFYPGTTPPSWDDTIRRYGFAFVQPGTRQEYSNLAFGLLAYVTELVSRTPREEFLEKTVFAPLGMTRTSDTPPEAERAIPYRMDAAGGFLRSAPYAFDHPGASVYWSTVNDLARFVGMHLGDGELEGVRVLKPESTRAMRTPAGTAQTAEGFSEGNLARTRFGIGWGVERYLGHECFWHSGGMPGVSNMVRAFPESGSAVIVLTNTDDRTMAREAALGASRVLLNEPTAPVYPPTPPIKPDAEAFNGAWTGTLHHFTGDIPVRLTLRDGNAEIAFGKRGTLGVSEVSFGRQYFTGVVDALLETRPDYHGVAPISLRLWRDGPHLTGFAMQTMNGYFGLSSYLELTR